MRGGHSKEAGTPKGRLQHHELASPAARLALSAAAAAAGTGETTGTGSGSDTAEQPACKRIRSRRINLTTRNGCLELKMGANGRYRRSPSRGVRHDSRHQQKSPPTMILAPLPSLASPLSSLLLPPLPPPRNLSPELSARHAKARRSLLRWRLEATRLLSSLRPGSRNPPPQPPTPPPPQAPPLRPAMTSARAEAPPVERAARWPEPRTPPPARVPGDTPST